MVLRRIWHHLSAGGCDDEKGTGPFHAPVIIALRTGGRWLHRLGISRLRDLTPDGDTPPKHPGQDSGVLVRVYGALGCEEGRAHS